jgi:adenosylcobinamide-GDP ribazoletransferase
MLPIARALPYARAGEGQGRVLGELGWGGCVLGALLALAVALPAGSAGLAGLGAAFVVSALVALYARHWLGGVTGDVLGAVAKLGESAALVVGLAVVG